MNAHLGRLAIATLLVLGIAVALAGGGAASMARTAVEFPQNELLQRGGKWEFGRKGSGKLCDVVLTTRAGTYGSVLKACNANESFWKLAGSTLVFLRRDGTASTRFKRVNANLWEGKYLLGPGIVHYLKRTGGTDMSTPPLATELLQRGGAWTFGRVPAMKLCDVVLTATSGRYGYVLKACNANESFWKLEGSTLVFLSAGGAPTTRFKRLTANHWQGAYLGTPQIPAAGIVHYLKR